MALVQPEHTGELVSDDVFAAAVRRNIKALLATHGMEQQDLAARLPDMSAAVLSSRMTAGKSRTSWRGAELVNIARLFDVDLDVVYALSEQDFREAYARSRCCSESGTSRPVLTVVPDLEDVLEQGELFTSEVNF
jgi:hypothetical protein